MSSRWPGRLMVLLGGVAGAAGGLVSFVLVVATALDGSGSGPGASTAVPLVAGLLVGGLMATLGWRRLGRRPTPAALLGAVVAAVGALTPWVGALLVGSLQ